MSRSSSSDALRRFVVEHPERIVFGAGTTASLDRELGAVGAQRVLLMGSARHASLFDRLSADLGERVVGRFVESAPQVPRALADRAIAAASEARADWLLAVGGGSTIGLAKAVALSLDVRIAAVPTTYSGSERTSIFGITEDGIKTTGRDDRARPSLVVYDPALTTGLPPEVSLPSLVNAMAHAVEALYAEDASPATIEAATEALAPLFGALPRIARAPEDLAARSEALYGAYQAGTALGGASMALHHKLCHVLGGSFGLPHAATHATLLPYSIAFNAPAAAAMHRALAAAFGDADPAAALYDQLRALGMGTDLRALGLHEDDVPRAVELALAKRYPNPRPIDGPALERLLLDAIVGRRPSAERETIDRDARDAPHGARVRPGDDHRITTADRAAPRRRGEATMNDDRLEYQAGFGNTLSTEARAGALPREQNAPRSVPFGLIAEQINGTGFTVARPHNRRTWMYRLRAQILDRGFSPYEHPRFTGRFGEGRVSPEVMRFRPAPLPEAPTDWLDGLMTFAGTGDPSLKRGAAIHLYAANRDMERRALCNADGDLLIVPEHGRLRLQTELGWLALRPGELAIVPRGIRFRVEVPDGAARGFVAELFDGHFRLPDRGVVGANGLADERHFLAPVAAFEDVREPFEIVVKQGGDLWRIESPSSPFDVVAWHGTYAPFKYDLSRFNSFGSVSFDHADPSILTVLTCPGADGNAIDVGVFQRRWDVTEHTFRPPYFHRNAAVEFNGVIETDATEGPWTAGTFSYTPYHTPHGISAAGVRRAVAASDEPELLSPTSMWIQFESTYPLRVMPWSLDLPNRDRDYLSSFRGYPEGRVD